MVNLLPVITQWAERQQKELLDNQHKGGWEKCDPEWLFNDMLYHASKLIYAMRHKEHEKVLEFAADVANLANMTADVYINTTPA